MGSTEMQWLLGFSDPVRGVGWDPRAARAARWRLGRMRALLHLLGDPDRTMRVVLIAGTKGKGSTAAFLASILHAGHVRAGLFTSPHLQAYRERVRIDGRMLAEAAFAGAIRDLRPTVAALHRPHPAAGAPTTTRARAPRSPPRPRATSSSPIARSAPACGTRYGPGATSACRAGPW